MSRLVPYLSETAIERDAAALLSEYARTRGLVITPPVPLEDILEKYLRLEIDFIDTHEWLGVPRSSLSEPDILGAIYFDEHRIVIDESLDPEERPQIEGRYRFTLAHEGGGHWRLHRHLFDKNPAQVSMFSVSGKPSVVCRSSQAKDRIEWQADFYASCLLMPRNLVFDAWRTEFGTDKPFIFNRTEYATRPRWNGPRSVGEILRDIAEPDHAFIFDKFAKVLAPSFLVSPQAMRIRLEKLGLLVGEIPQQQPIFSKP
jgi:Zn-dependent peptidase ImmA (M78 family)